MPGPLLALLLVATAAITPLATGSFGWTVLALVGIVVVDPVIRAVRKHCYFASGHFQSLRAEVASVVAEHDAVVSHVEEIRARGTFQLASSSSGQHAHLASFDNTSRWR